MSVPFGQWGFAVGEVSPALYGDVALQKLTIACTTARNCFVDYRGGLKSRAGFVYVGTSAQSFTNGPPRLIRFQFSLSQGIVLEFGEEYLRFIENGAYILSSGSPYQISTPYRSGDLRYIKVAQSADVMSLTCVNPSTADIVGSISGTTLTVTAVNSGVVPVGGIVQSSGTAVDTIITANGTGSGGIGTYTVSVSQTVTSQQMNIAREYPPYDLARLSAAHWTLTLIDLDADNVNGPGCSVEATTHPSTSTSPPTYPTAYAFIVNAVDPQTGQTSHPGDIGYVTNSVDIADTAGSLIVSWSAITLPSGNQPYYQVYKAPPSYNTNTSSSTDANPPPAGSLFGLVGVTYSTQFIDSNITPDLTQTPPVHANPFAPGQILSASASGASSDFTGTPTVTLSDPLSTGSGGEVDLSMSWAYNASTGTPDSCLIIRPGTSYSAGTTASSSGGGGTTQPTITLKIGPQSGTYPGVTAYFQQRRLYAGTLNNPDTLYASQPGRYIDFDTSQPPVDSDAITATPWSVQVNGIQWMQPMPANLVVFTGNGSWIVGGSGSFLASIEPITPTNTQAVPQAAVGSSAIIPPQPVNYDILYVTAKGYSVRDLVYQPYFSLYIPRDISILSTHLLEGHTLLEWAWAEEPNKVLWAVRDDGVLLSLTYLQEQEVYGWARHDTAGLFCSVCSVVEPPVDALYAVVQRYLGGSWVYAIERMDNRLWKSIEDAVCVDCAFQLDQPQPVSQISVSGSNVIGASVTVAAYNGAPFLVGNVGSVIRAAGGILKITAFTSSTSVTAQVYLPMTIGVAPGATGNTAPPVFVQQGDWTMTAPVSSVTITDAVSGSHPLASMVVYGMADGVPIGPLTASSGGVVTLPFAASQVTLGLLYSAQFQSVYANPPGPTGQGKRKDITDAVIRVSETGYGNFYNSTVPLLQGGSNQPDGAAQSPMSIAPSWSNMVPVVPGPDAKPPLAYQSVGGVTVMPLYSGDCRSWLQGTWRKPGQIAVQAQGVPLGLTAVVPDIDPGDLPEAGIQGNGQQQGGRPIGRAPSLRMLS